MVKLRPIPLLRSFKTLAKQPYFSLQALNNIDNMVDRHYHKLQQSSDAYNITPTKKHKDEKFSTKPNFVIHSEDDNGKKTINIKLENPTYYGDDDDRVYAKGKRKISPRDMLMENPTFTYYGDDNSVHAKGKKNDASWVNLKENPNFTYYGDDNSVHAKGKKIDTSRVNLKENPNFTYYGDDNNVHAKGKKIDTPRVNLKENPNFTYYGEDNSVYAKGKGKITLDNLKENPSFSYDTKVQCVDAYEIFDYDDDIKIIKVRSTSSSTSLRNKGKMPLSGPYSMNEIKEISREKFAGGNKKELNYRQQQSSIVPLKWGLETEIEFDCEICAYTKPQIDCFKIKGCNHTYCSDCVRKYVNSKLENGVSRINCLDPNCSSVLDPDNCKDILTFDVIVKWGNLLCEASILDSQKFYCPFKDCSALLINDGAKVTRSECPSCHRLFCAQCCIAGWHEDITCDEYQALSKDDDSEINDIKLKKLAMSMRWQRCPYCKAYVEKIDGCSHIDCRCRATFCYSCGLSCVSSLGSHVFTKICNCSDDSDSDSDNDD